MEKKQSGPPPDYTAPAQGYGYPPQQGLGNQPQQGYGYPPQQGFANQPQQGQYYPPQAYYGPGTNVVVQQPQVAYVSQPPPPDMMTSAILVTLCCFWPTGIFAIMRASDARSAAARGDMVSAQSHARSAKTMVNISVAIGIISMVIVGVIIGIYVALIASSDPYNYYN